MENIKISQFEHYNQFVIRTSQGVLFQSYDSQIAFIEYGLSFIHLSKDWDYSLTTKRHLFKFINDYTNLNVKCSKDVETLLKERKAVIDLKA